MRIHSQARTVLALLALSLGLALLLAGPAAAAPRAHQSIINGKPAPIAEYPFLAFVQAREDLGRQGELVYSCTGTVIAPRVVLSAGHCVEDVERGVLTPAGDFEVVTGVANPNQVGATRSSVVRAIPYPSFELTRAHGDAGLLILKDPVPDPPLALAGPADAALLNAGTPLRIAGWGLTDIEGESASPEFRAGTTMVQASDVCRRKARRYYKRFSPELQLCAIDQPTHTFDICHGDSGGPALATRPDGTTVEVGITSLSDGGCDPSKPAFFTRVDQISAWAAGWVAAVETGAAPPVLPRPKLPKLTVQYGAAIAAGTIERLPRDADFLALQRLDCAAAGKLAVHCKVAWSAHGFYFGTITSRFVYEHEATLVSTHYRIHRVSPHCAAEPPGTRGCAGHLLRG